MACDSATVEVAALVPELPSIIAAGPDTEMLGFIAGKAADVPVPVTENVNGLLVFPALCAIDTVAFLVSAVVGSKATVNDVVAVAATVAEKLPVLRTKSVPLVPPSVGVCSVMLVVPLFVKTMLSVAVAPFAISCEPKSREPEAAAPFAMVGPPDSFTTRLTVELPEVEPVDEAVAPPPLPPPPQAGISSPATSARAASFIVELVSFIVSPI